MVFWEPSHALTNELYVCMNYNHMPVMPNKDSLTTMSFMVFQENNLVTYRGTTGAMLSWGGYASWPAKQVEVHSPANTPDVDVMFAMALLGKIKHTTLYSSKISRVPVDHLTYTTRESAILATGFHVGRIVFPPEISDSLKPDSMLGPSNSLVNERYDFVRRILAAAAAYGSAEQLRVARDHYLTTTNPLTLTEEDS